MGGGGSLSPAGTSDEAGGDGAGGRPVPGETAGGQRPGGPQRFLLTPPPTAGTLSPVLVTVTPRTPGPNCLWITDLTTWPKWDRPIVSMPDSFLFLERNLFLSEARDATELRLESLVPVEKPLEMGCASPQHISGGRSYIAGSSPPRTPLSVSASVCVSLSLSAGLSVPFCPPPPRPPSPLPPLPLSVSATPSPPSLPPFPLSLRPDNKHDVTRSPSCQLVRLKNPQVSDVVGKEQPPSSQEQTGAATWGVSSSPGTGHPDP